jgi:hypothetical protein
MDPDTVPQALPARSANQAEIIQAIEALTDEDSSGWVGKQRMAVRTKTFFRRQWRELWKASAVGIQKE